MKTLIKRIRKDAKLTQAQLAEKTGLSVAAIQGYEQGKFKPRFFTLLHIAAALGIPAPKLKEYCIEDYELTGDLLSQQAAERLETMINEKVSQENGVDKKEDMSPEKRKELEDLKEKAYNQLLFDPEQVRKTDLFYTVINELNELNSSGLDEILHLIRLLEKVPELKAKKRPHLTISNRKDDTPD